MNARDRFKELAALPDDEIPLAEAALWISAETRPYVDVDHWLGEIDRLADGLGPKLETATSDLERVEILNHGLFRLEGFSGNTADYASPLNSFLDSVLESRQGIPITLSIIYIEVAQRLNLNSFGVGFPGHFLVKVLADEDEVIVDPFFGCTLSQADCQNRLQEVAGKEAVLDPRMLEATPHREILQRVLRNLKLYHVSQKEYEAALACSERILLLAGDDLMELRDRGLIYRELECVGPALEDLERYLAFAPGDPNAAALSEVVRDLREKVRMIH